MNEEDFKRYNDAAIAGTIPDDQNPIFLFSSTATALLVKGLAKEFSFTEMARYTLASRGLNLKGEWVGFEKAKKKIMLASKKKRGRHL